MPHLFFHEKWDARTDRTAITKVIKLVTGMRSAAAPADTYRYHNPKSAKTLIGKTFNILLAELLISTSG